MSLDAHLRPLLRPARLPVVARYLGQLSLVLAALCVVPGAVALALGEVSFALAIALGAVLPATVIGLAALLPPPRDPLQSNEALVITASTFLLAALLMTLPLHVAGLPWLDALFEAISGVTTTGLTTQASPGERGAALLFTRSWMQWFGGLGFVALSLALLSGQQNGEHRRLADPAWEAEDLAGSTRAHARRVFGVYLVLTGGGLIALWASGLPPFSALVHTLSAVSTGGFSPQPTSLADLARPVQIAALGTAFCAALPLPLYFRTLRRGPRELLGDVEARALVVAISLVTALLWLVGSIPPADALLQAASAQTGTGFSTVDVSRLDPAAKWALMLSMFSGAGIGSTAGGIKILRLLLLLRLVHLLVLRSMLPPHAVAPLRLGGHGVSADQLERAFVVVLLFLGVIMFSWLPFLAAGHPPLDGLFEVVSATATVGLSSGITGPDLEPWLKGVLCADMLLGRLEILALLVVLYPRTWTGAGRY